MKIALVKVLGLLLYFIHSHFYCLSQGSLVNNTVGLETNRTFWGGFNYNLNYKLLFSKENHAVYPKIGITHVNRKSTLNFKSQKYTYLQLGGGYQYDFQNIPFNLNVDINIALLSWEDSKIHSENDLWVNYEEAVSNPYFRRKGLLWDQQLLFGWKLNRSFSISVGERLFFQNSTSGDFMITPGFVLATNYYFKN